MMFSARSGTYALLPRALAIFGLASAACSKPTELTIGSVGDSMTYDAAALDVHAGATVHLTLKNNATMPDMRHNWVLAAPGSEATVAAEGQSAGDAQGYVPLISAVLAHTGQVPPGKTGEVTFTAPSAGDYPYLCTNPGHSITMKGTLHVR